jgi:GH15 family glucan-1,4-alpha-glucosidase
MRPTRSDDGFAPITDYGVLGDGRTSALVAADGRLEWWPLPALDSPPVVGAILDPGAGGQLLLAPGESFDVQRRYLEGTNVLEATYKTASGRLKVTSALNVGAAGRLPWTELVFRVEGLSGRVPMRWELTPGTRFGQASPWVSMSDATPIVNLGDQSVAIVTDGMGAPTVAAHTVYGGFTTEVGLRSVLACTATDGEPVFIPSAASIDARLDRTVEAWRRWSAQLAPLGQWTPAVIRSALALKTLITEASGAVAAAVTTSLPERIGGDKNWDYRYAWVRDSSFTIDALISLGLHEEAHGAVSWILDAVRRNGPELRVFYTLAGDLPDGERDLAAPGYRHSTPVRAGNAAAHQIQLGTYGDLFDTIYRYAQEGHALDPGTGRMLSDLAERCCNEWRSPDSGIWELDALEHYTISKIGCWVALDRAVRLARAGQIPVERVDRWEAEASEIRAWIDRWCWSDRKKAYVFYAGTEHLDASVLLCGRTGFDRGPRLATTIDALETELGPGPLYARYTRAKGQEGAFVACTFWMVQALALTGHRARASRLMNDAVRLTNDVGLLSEQIDRRSGAFLGNMPQALSHLALINAATELHRTTEP